MDSKRQPVPNVAATTKTVNPSKTNVPKTTSEASMTPSQLAASEAAKARKHPLDVLSRSVLGRHMEKRSGLQDVDDEFLKQNFFARQGFGRHSGLNESNMYAGNLQNTPAAGQPSGMAQNVAAMNATNAQQMAPMDGGAQVQYVPAHTGTAQQQMNQQQMAQQQMQQQMAQQQMQGQVPPNVNMPAAGQPSSMSANIPQMHSQQSVPASQQGQQMHPSPSQQSQVPVAPSQTNTMAGNQIPATPSQVAQHQQGQPPVQHQMQPPQPEPDMCTTCPNCQTTIYLVRPDAAEMQQIQQAVN